MSKNVYLFELDSVRMTDDEIIKAQKTLYDEIVANGNTVVMTYNQVVDSRGFFCLLKDKEYYDSIINLFEMGKIKVSQYGDTRTLTQYLLNSLEDEKQFIYSALPIKNNQKRLMALMKRSLTYTDLSEIYEYFEGGSRTEAELEDLFVELNHQKEEKSRLSIHDMRGIINNLYWMLSAIMKLSTRHDIYLAPRDRGEYENLLLYHYLMAAMTIPRTDALWCKAKDIIEHLSAFEDKSMDRSVYLREIKDVFIKNQNECSPDPYQYAEAIINLCYNYTCEASICNISKHYNVDEISGQYNINKSTTFYWDFLSRLSDDWQNGTNAGSRYLTDETNALIMFDRLKDIPKFSNAVRLISYINPNDNSTSEKQIHRYEYNAKAYQKQHKKAIIKKLSLKLITVLFFLILACVFEVGSNHLQDFLGEKAHISGWVFSSIITIVFLLAMEVVTTLIQKRFRGFLTLSDALSGLLAFIVDTFRITRAKSQAYFNAYDKKVEYAEDINTGIPIDYVKTSEIKKYIRLFKDRKNDKLFAKSDMYSFYDIEENGVVRDLLRDEEMYHSRYGVIYQSPYNTLLVDPVDYNGNCIPYERMTPSSGYDGVVVIIKHNDNYILLRQFRHALREMQYSFVRGYAECDDPIEDVKRELNEEIGVTDKDFISQPKLIGRVAADSGLATTQAYIYYAEISNFDPQVGHEGIREAIEIPCEQFGDWIHSGKINDGYTLSAYALSSL